MDIKVLTESENTQLPSRAHEFDGGSDIRSSEKVEILPMQRKLVNTGLRIEVPKGFAGLVVSRSGLATNHGVCVLNAPGVIDFGYTGLIKVNLINLGNEKYTINCGDKIAQFLLTKVEFPNFFRVDKLAESERGENGHGSTGK